MSGQIILSEYVRPGVRILLSFLFNCDASLRPYVTELNGNFSITGPNYNSLQLMIIAVIVTRLSWEYNLYTKWGLLSVELVW